MCCLITDYNIRCPITHYNMYCPITYYNVCCPITHYNVVQLHITTSVVQLQITICIVQLHITICVVQLHITIYVVQLHITMFFVQLHITTCVVQLHITICVVQLHITIYVVQLHITTCVVQLHITTMCVLSSYIDLLISRIICMQSHWWRRRRKGYERKIYKTHTHTLTDVIVVGELTTSRHSVINPEASLGSADVTTSDEATEAVHLVQFLYQRVQLRLVVHPRQSAYHLFIGISY